MANKYTGPYDTMYPLGVDGPSYHPGDSVPNLSKKRLEELRAAGITFEDDPLPAPPVPISGVTPEQQAAKDAADANAKK